MKVWIVFRLDHEDVEVASVHATEVGANIAASGLDIACDEHNKHLLRCFQIVHDIESHEVQP